MKKKPTPKPKPRKAERKLRAGLDRGQRRLHTPPQRGSTPRPATITAAMVPPLSLDIHPLASGLRPNVVKAIAQDFRPELFGTLQVVKEGKRLLIVDGVARLHGATIALGTDIVLPCLVYDGPKMRIIRGDLALLPKPPVVAHLAEARQELEARQEPPAEEVPAA